MNTQNKLTIIQEIIKAKNIDQKDIQLALSMLISSSLIQALEITKPDNLEQNLKLEDFDNEIQNIKSETDLETFNSKINSLLSKDGTSFKDTFKSIFNNLLEKYIEELEKL